MGAGTPTLHPGYTRNTLHRPDRQDQERDSDIKHMCIAACAGAIAQIQRIEER
jgi:hypothetical protein